MKKPTTLTIWSIKEESGTEFFPTRRAAKAYIAEIVRECDLAGVELCAWERNQKPEKHEVQFWDGRSLMSALFEGIRIGQFYPNDNA